jgi:hypothetical protein
MNARSAGSRLVLVVMNHVAAVRYELFHGWIDVHLLGNSVAHHLCDQSVCEIPALATIGRVLDLAEQLDHLAMVTGEDVHYVVAGRSVIGVGHRTFLLQFVSLRVR